jgi:hypothetical protein
MSPVGTPENGGKDRSLCCYLALDFFDLLLVHEPLNGTVFRN